MLYIIEIKSTKSPQPKDIRNLLEFSKELKKPHKAILFYLGEEYQIINNVNIVPIAFLFNSI
jgi:hypothetical protein